MSQQGNVSCSIRLIGKQLRHSLPSQFLLQLMFYFICCRSFFLNSVWTETKRLKGELQQQNKLVRLSSSLSWMTVSLAYTIVGRSESECEARTAKQIILTSPVVKTHSMDWPGRSTESVTDWANRKGAIGFLPVLSTDAWWGNAEISQYCQTVSLIAVSGY